MPDKSLILYSTDGCHLCEEALKMLNSLKLDVQVMDIAFDDDLFFRYGVTIPVVSCGESELGWPFEIEELQNWLKKNGITYHK
ncbi:glutaredoxin family protein [Vibrio hannami]|uniref:glutaredoxin family protein n=1 Tax=Vibrio hannami TaxID=2717094 RepID=UPI00240EB68F|nr:glutaredoxin family protein [Vibrio hannami]MDG3088095.1 glutaredoxin family protein [Vibrio hannami]